MVSKNVESRFCVVGEAQCSLEHTRRVYALLWKMRHIRFVLTHLDIILAEMFRLVTWSFQIYPNPARTVFVALYVIRQND